MESSFCVIKVLYVDFDIFGIQKKLRIEKIKDLEKFKRNFPEAKEVSRLEVEEYC